MLFSDKKLRIYGLLSFAIIYFVFFLLQEFIKPHAHTGNLLLKSFGSTFIFITTLWEPVRFIILWAYKKWGNEKKQLRRKLLSALILVPYAFVLGIGGQILENYLIWQIPLKKINPGFYLGIIGLNMVFILAEFALYESYFLINKWHMAAIEMKELKKSNLQLQYDSLKVQIQPHFLFNTLNTLIGLIKMDTSRAIVFTEEMAHVYRYLLEANDRQLISLEEEMKFTRAYFFLLKTRYSEGLHLEITHVAHMENYQLPPLSLQILIENAVKHNIITKDKPLYIKIELSAALKQLVVSNNLQKKSQVSNSGYGLMHLKKKFELLHMTGVKIRQEKTKFLVTIPIESKAYAGSNY
jgi:sensor histidine kinase YesM